MGAMIQCLGTGTGMSQTTGTLGQAIGSPVATTASPIAFPSVAPMTSMVPMTPMGPLQIQSGEAMPTLPTDVPLALGVARGAGGTYKVGESLNVAYQVNQALTIRVVALQDGAWHTHLMLEVNGVNSAIWNYEA